MSNETFRQYYLLMKHLHMNKTAIDELEVYERDLLAKRIVEELGYNE